MMINKRVGLIFFLSVLLVCNSACTSMQPVTYSHPQEIGDGVVRGDTVLITQHDDSQVTFVVDHIGEKGISGSNDDTQVYVAYEDIRELRVEAFSENRTVGLVLGSGLGAVILLGFIALSMGVPSM